MTPVHIRNIDIYPFACMQDLIEYAKDNKKLLLSVNAEILMKAEGRLADIINKNIGYADGFGAVKALKQKGINNVTRIPGCELWLQFIEKYHTDKSFYLVGATQETIQATVRKLKNNYPGINITGYRNGYIRTPQERKALIKDIADKKPDFIFVAMGFPAQEILMEEMYDCHPAVYLNLGGSFDVFTGKVKRAPLCLQKIGLEWLYRFVKQPSRYKRQIVYLQFLWSYCMRKL